ncbi:hypothetical protein PoB_005619300 [Plakobranchus ocellatus]|uniref:Uncharacterized protein n=1 Tax=Plakobranchus ocellatus TaxID=259542 RepID=A0AAV4CE09_9GAST|nr:hypothetical protein PoB_005619300 [Plakobranchus ocellatus]
MQLDLVLCMVSPQEGDLGLSGAPSGQGARGGARTRDIRIFADLKTVRNSFDGKKKKRRNESGCECGEMDASHDDDDDDDDNNNYNSSRDDSCFVEPLGERRTSRSRDEQVMSTSTARNSARAECVASGFEDSDDESFPVKLFIQPPKCLLYSGGKFSNYAITALSWSGGLLTKKQRI